MILVDYVDFRENIMETHLLLEFISLSWFYSPLNTVLDTPRKLHTFRKTVALVKDITHDVERFVKVLFGVPRKEPVFCIFIMSLRSIRSSDEGTTIWIDSKTNELIYRIFLIWFSAIARNSISQTGISAESGDNSCRQIWYEKAWYTAILA